MPLPVVIFLSQGMFREDLMYFSPPFLQPAPPPSCSGQNEKYLL